MKYITIVTVLLLLQVSLATINAIQFTIGYQVQPYEEAFKQVKDDTIVNQEYFQSSATQDTSISFGFGDFVKGLFIFIKILTWGILAIPYTLTKFGLDTNLAIYISIPVYFMYGLGIAQFIANRSTKGMQ